MCHPVYLTSRTDTPELLKLLKSLKKNLSKNSKTMNYSAGREFGLHLGEAVRFPRRLVRVRSARVVGRRRRQGHVGRDAGDVGRGAGQRGPAGRRRLFGPAEERREPTLPSPGILRHINSFIPNPNLGQQNCIDHIAADLTIYGMYKQSSPLVWSTDARSTRLYGQFLTGPNHIIIILISNPVIGSARLYG